MIIRKVDNLYIVKIMNNRLKDFDIFNQEKIKELFKDIIINIKKKYNLTGLLDINAYVNKYYGIIIEIESIYAYTDKIDMHIHFHLDSIFMNEINDFDIPNKEEVYYYKNKFYSVYHKITDSNIIYRVDDILEKGIRVI